MIEPRRLIINADDLGITAEVNRGILEAHAAGVVTSASLLATGESFDHAVTLLRGAPTLGVGVHLDFVAGRPLTAAPSLVDARTGRFHPLGVLTRRAFLGRVRARDVMAETEAQIARVRSSGARVTHVDGHRHAYLLPGIWSAVVAAAASAGLCAVRIPAERVTASRARRDPRLAMKMLALRGAVRLATGGRSRPIHADHFAGLALQGRRDFGARLLDLLDHLPLGTTELMVHPGYTDERLAALDSYREPREVELRALLSAPVRERLRRGDITLVSFAALTDR